VTDGVIVLFAHVKLIEVFLLKREKKTFRLFLFCTSL